MRAGVWTMPAALARAGYATALVGKNHFLPHFDGSPRDLTYEQSLEQLRTLGF